jgi:pimeloyl-ACP methyl ester carboxylesterase
MGESNPAADKLTPMELRELEVDGTASRFRVFGDGPPVVLVHGLSGSWRWWSAVAERLAERRRVSLLDLPPLRRRFEPRQLAGWLGRWLETAGLQNADLVGHSLGGLVAAELAAERPELVGRLALVAPAGIPCGRGLVSRSLPLLETLYDIRAQFPTVVGDAVRAGPLGLLRGAAFVSERDLRPALGGIRAPSLLVWGDRDRLVPTSIAEEWQRALPRSRLVLLPCGHVPMWEAPAELAESLLAFLEEEPLDEVADELRPREVHGVGLTGDVDEPRSR